MRWRSIAALMALTALLPLGGCVNQEPLGSFIFVQAMAVDCKDGLFTLHCSVFDPAAANGAGGDYADRINNVLSGEGQSVSEAIANMNLHSPRVIDLSRNRALFLSDAVLRRHLGDVMDFFSRYHQLRLLTAVYGYRGDVSETVRSGMHNAVNPAESMRDLSKYGAKRGFLQQTDCLEIISSLYDDYSGFVLPVVKRWNRDMAQEQDGNQNDSLVLDGLALYGDRQFKAYLNEETARGLAWLTGHDPPQFMTVLELPNGSRWSVRATEKSGRIKTDIRDGLPRFTIELSTKATLIEAASPDMVAITPEALRLGGERYAETVGRQIETALDQTLRKHGADPIYLYRQVAKWQNGYWRTLPKPWRQLVQNAEIKIEVKAAITRVGQSDTVI